MTTRSARRILAVDPGMKYLGIAVLEGENLLWYGVKAFPSRRILPDLRVEVRQALTKILRKYRPDVLAVEEPFYAQSLLSRNLKKLTCNIKAWGKTKGLAVRSYAPPAVKGFFCPERKTKQSLGEVIVAKYPFLARCLTHLAGRRRYWFHVLDAVALGLFCRSKLAC
jgi:RNase H-fold protein (predicted Holliday junction resolvase)